MNNTRSFWTRKTFILQRWTLNEHCVSGCESSAQVEQGLQMDRLWSLHMNFPHLQQVLQTLLSMHWTEVALPPALPFTDERGACSSTLQIWHHCCSGWWAGKAPSLLDVWGHQHFSHLFNEEPPPVRFLLLPGWLDWCPQDVGVVMGNVNQVVEEGKWPAICSPPAGVGGNNLTKT